MFFFFYFFDIGLLVIFFFCHTLHEAERHNYNDDKRRKLRLTYTHTNIYTSSPRVLSSRRDNSLYDVPHKTLSFRQCRNFNGDDRENSLIVEEYEELKKKKKTRNLHCR